MFSNALELRLRTDCQVQGIDKLVAAVGQELLKVLAVVPPPNCEVAPLSWFVAPRWPRTFAPAVHLIPKLRLFTVVVFGKSV